MITFSQIGDSSYSGEDFVNSPSACARIRTILADAGYSGSTESTIDKLIEHLGYVDSSLLSQQRWQLWTVRSLLHDMHQCMLDQVLVAAGISFPHSRQDSVYDRCLEIANALEMLDDRDSQRMGLGDLLALIETRASGTVKAEINAMLEFLNESALLADRQYKPGAPWSIEEVNGTCAPPWMGHKTSRLPSDLSNDSSNFDQSDDGEIRRVLSNELEGLDESIRGPLIDICAALFRRFSSQEVAAEHDGSRADQLSNEEHGQRSEDSPYQFSPRTDSN